MEPSREVVEDLLAHLTDSAKPLIIVGGEAAFSPLFSQSLLLELAGKLDAYIAVTVMVVMAARRTTPAVSGE